LNEFLARDLVPLGDGRIATRVEVPATIDALREAVARGSSEGMGIYPQGGRTALDYGGSPARDGVAVDLRMLNRVVDYPAADMTITLEAGLTLKELHATLAREGQRLPIDAPRADRATIGGVYATNTSGPRRYGAGRPRDFIIGVGFVTAEGRLVRGGGRVVKNVAGYDFPKLMTGSLGTLGIVAELTLKVVPRPEASAVVWIECERLEDASRAVDHFHADRTRPKSLELLNAAASERARGLGAPAPETPWCVAVGLEDNRASVRFQVEEIARAFGARRVRVGEDDESERSWSALTAIGEAALFPVGLVATLRPSEIASLVAELDPARWCIQAHAGSGVVRLGRTTLEADEPVEEIAGEVKALRARAVGGGGGVIVAQAPAAWKVALKVWGDPRADWSWMRKLKQAFDPAGVLNPGRFAGMM
jgi:glycolate oxidase FAD binding subunit